MNNCKKKIQRPISQRKRYDIGQTRLNLKEKEDMIEIVAQNQSIELMELWMEKNLLT